VSQFSGGRLSFDADGTWARQGTIHEALIARWLQEPYFRQAPPKSTGRESFGGPDLERRLRELAALTPDDRLAADALATLSSFAAAVVAADLNLQPRPLEVLVAGGGCRNGVLMEQLRRRCRGLAVRPLQELGIADCQREALAFALLAWWHHRGHPGSLPSVTGARQAAVLGVRVEPAGGASRGASGGRRSQEASGA
jgi:anhydro-N-acetylmuramic acid kinase